MSTLRTALALGAGLMVACESATPPTPSNPTNVGFIGQPTPATAGANMSPSIVVAIQDDQGRTVTSSNAAVTIALDANPGSATLIGTTTVTAVNGVARFTDLRLEKAASGYTLTASSSGLASATSVAFTVNPGPAAKTAFITQPSTATAGAAISPVIRIGIYDAYDNLQTASSAPVTIAFANNPGSGKLSGTTTTAAISGIANFVDVSINKSGDGYTLASSSPNLTGATSSPFKVNGAAVTKIVFLTPPSAVTAGAAFSPIVQVAVKDAFDNVANLATGDVTIEMGLNPGAGALSGATTVALSNGIATFTDLNIKKAANGYTLVASHPNVGPVHSGQFNVSPGAPAKTKFLVDLMPTFRSRDPIGHPVHVVVLDAHDNVVETATNQITLSIGTNPSAGTLFGTITKAAVNGLASFTDVSIDKVGTGYTLAASGTGLQSSTSSAFSIIQGEPAQLVFLDQPSATNEAGLPYPTIRVAVQDVGGNLVLDRSMNLELQVATSSSGGKVVTFPFSLNNRNIVDGIATFDGIKLDRPGTYTLKVYRTFGTPELGPVESNQITVTHQFAKITVGGGPAFSFPVTENRYSCSLSTSGVAHCWGQQISGAMGVVNDNAQAILSQPELVTTSQLFRDISAGSNHTCAVNLAGAAYCWGFDSHGELGDGDPQGGTKVVPVAVPGGLHFVSISAGYEHTCGVTSAGPGASSGPAYCWGRNDFGQVGDGSTEWRRTPVPVTGGLTFIAVSASRGGHTCGVTSDFLLYCWGLNTDGQLGDNTIDIRPTPTLVTDAATHLFRSVYTGREHTCAVRADNATYCWGSNTNQQIGDGNTATTDRLTPSLVTVALGAGSAGWYHNCALGAAGGARCWGLNQEGELGDNSTTESNAPVLVAGSLNFTQVSAGRDHSCGVTSDGEAYCWGGNAHAQLGDGTTMQRLTPVRVFP